MREQRFENHIICLPGDRTDFFLRHHRIQVINFVNSGLPGKHHVVRTIPKGAVKVKNYTVVCVFSDWPELVCMAAKVEENFNLLYSSF